MLEGDKVTLEYKMTSGETLTYQSIVNSSQSLQEDDQVERQTDSVLEMVMDQHVKDVKDGIASIDVTIKDGHMKRDHESMPLPSVGQTINISMKRNGDIVKTSVGFPFSQPAFPSHQLKVGDFWTADNPMEIPIGDDGQNKSIVLTYKYTLAKFDRLKGYDVAVVEVSCPPTNVDIDENIKQTIEANGHTMFAHREGRLVASEVNTHTKIVAPGATIDTKIQVLVNLDNSAQMSFGPATLASEQESFIIGM